MTCPMRTFPLFNFVTFLIRGVAILIPTLEGKLKEVSLLFHQNGYKQNPIKSE